MRGRRSFGVGVVGLVLVTGLLAGCSGDDDQPVAQPTMVRPTAVHPTESGSATASGTATSTGPVVPKAARAHTFAGADAFARFYFAQLNKAWTAPDPAAIRGLSTSSCKTCSGFLRNAETFVATGQHYARPAVTVKSSAWQPESTHSLARVDLVVRQETADIVDAADRTRTHAPAQRGVLRCEVQWTPSGWSMASVKHLVIK